MVYLPMAYLYGKKFVGPTTPTILALREEIYSAHYLTIDWAQARSSCAKVIFGPGRICWASCWGRSAPRGGGRVGRPRRRRRRRRWRRRGAGGSTRLLPAAPFLHHRPCISPLTVRNDLWVLVMAGGSGLPADAAAECGVELAV